MARLTLSREKGWKIMTVRDNRPSATSPAPLLPDSRRGAHGMKHRFALLAISGALSKPRPIRRRHALTRLFFCFREFTR